MNPLQDQVLNDSKLCDDLQKEAKHARALREHGVNEKPFRDAASYFGVSRSLPGIAHSAQVLAASVNAVLEDWQGAGDGCQALLATADCVDDLAGRFKAATGRFSVSAASKLLWLAYGPPFRVYDNRARVGLANLTGGPLRTDYCAFLRDWESAYAENAPEVRSAVEAVDLATLGEWQSLPVPEGTTREEDLAARIFDKWLFIQGEG